MVMEINVTQTFGKGAIYHWYFSFLPLPSFFNGWAAGGMGASSSGRPALDLNLPLAEDPDRQSLDLNMKPEAKALFDQEMAFVKIKKQTLAGLLTPLIERESQKYKNLGQIPSTKEIMEQLIRDFASPGARWANNHTTDIADLRCLKTWLTRACQNAEDDTKGNLSLRTELGIIVRRFMKGDPGD